MENKKTIQFQYVFPDNYNPVYCNGAYGGIATKGEIIMNFYLERMPVPKALTYEINDDGSLGNMLETEPDDFGKKVIRYVSSGVVLSEMSAKAIYEWLGRQICELESQKIAQKQEE